MKITEAEWKVMQILWDAHPATARDVHDAVREETGWAYTTAKTILDRLAEKGAVAVRTRGNVNWYAPIVTREEARRSEIRSLVDRAFDGAFGPLVHFLLADERMSPKERAELRRLLDEESGERDR